MTRTPVPREVRWAGLALWIIGTLSALSALLAVLTRSERIDDLRDSGTVLTDAEIQRSITLGVTITVVFALGVAVTAAVSAINAPRGRRWARVSGTVVAAVTAAVALVRLVAGGPIAPVHFLVLLASAAALVLLYRRPVTRFFAAP